MARKCKVCGDEMKVQVGEHYSDTGKGRALYRDVRRYTCVNGCRGDFYDFSRAIRADSPIRILGFIKAPTREVNVVDPLLAVGLAVVTLLMIAAFLMSMLPLGAKVAAVTLLTIFAVWLMLFMSSGERGDEREAD